MQFHTQASTKEEPLSKKNNPIDFVYKKFTVKKTFILWP